MIVRAILWCGYVKPPVLPNQLDGDVAASINDLHIAFEGARALGASPHEIHACVCDPNLLPQTFEASCRPASIAALRGLTAEIARRAAPGDVLLFVATNHGEERGASKGLMVTPSAEEIDARALADDDDLGEAAPLDPHSLLTPEALALCLDPLPGTQILVVATCHAGCFLDVAAPDRRMVLASCSAREKYWVQRAERSRSAFIAELFAAWCGIGLWDDQPREKLALDAAFLRAKQRLADAGARTIPLCEGSITWPLR
jgi:hypothetical protein